MRVGVKKSAHVSRIADIGSGATTARAHRPEISAALESEPDLEALYVRYHEFVRRALSRHYVDPNDLDDMTQHVFLVLLRRVDKATQKRSIGAWLYQIARRVAAIGSSQTGSRRRTSCSTRFG